MMIALTLSAIVTVGVIQLFTANSETYNLMQGQSRMQESARFALDFMGRAIQQAGYKGCWSENEDVFTTIDPETNIPYEFNLMRGIEGYNADNFGGWDPDITTEITSFVGANAIDTSAVIPGTDVLTVRYASQTEMPLSDNLSPGDDIEVEMPSSGLEIALDDLALIHDCEKSTIFRITQLLPDTPNTDEATIGHDTNDTDATRNSITRLAEVNQFELGTGFVSAIRASTFFIAPGAGINNAGDNPFSLWRKFGTDAPVELVEGVEDLQILYGLDSDSDGTPNQYVPAHLVTDYADVVTVRIAVTVNSVDDVGATSPPTHGCVADGGEQPCYAGEDYDGLIRRTFHQTIQVRNKG